MLIGIDAHHLEGNRTGVGRYLINLLQEWSKFNDQLSLRPELGARAISNVKFVLYFKDEVPADLPKSEFFENKLLKVGSTAKFMHWDLPRVAKKAQVDILFCPGYIAPICYSGKIALTLHDIIYEAHPEWFNWQSLADRILLKWVSKKSAKKADVIFVISEFTRQEVIRCYKVAPEKIKLINLAADASLTKFSGDDLHKIKEKYRIENKFAFYVGSIFSRRHLAEIIEAFGRLAAQKPDLQLILGGKDYTQEKNIADLMVRQNDALAREVVVRVDFIGDSDLKLLYSACAFFIWLSDYEGFGLPPLEAMSCGAPVITSDATSLKEVAGDAAFLIRNNSDVEEIYQAMRRLIEDENLRQELIRKGKEQAKKFSWERCARETFEGLIMSK